MLEQRIENLENQVTKLTTAIEKLIEVLTSGTAPTPTPPPLPSPLAPLSSMPEEEHADLDAQTGSAPTQPKVEEVQKALVELTHVHGREAAVSLLNSFHGANKVGDLDKDQYAEVIAAADNLTWKVAA
ncbi:hypothetical protein [Candidatus Williamhamiltonella defendens]|uniref:Uncharacterized protein n=1 Tax=Candidatus Hamiltonella defensa (Bemisia tabaci) TaxID=672795 RepID=A0A249DXT6_9ENTR|nr:hypothetical protein [Candidatus Hamiltonella defensa]ASX25890.1 hypothetical protein BA171_01735 [Candidatus Hamiltonella defensa (Bemisia tabaci)]CED78261.1 Protein of unknown function [Candidatus Hamiltonella defensa (Bemisia tabaci)]